MALRIYKTGEDLGCRNRILILDVFVLKKNEKMPLSREKNPSKTEMKKCL